MVRVSKRYRLLANLEGQHEPSVRRSALARGRAGGGKAPPNPAPRVTCAASGGQAGAVLARILEGSGNGTAEGTQVSGEIERGSGMGAGGAETAKAITHARSHRPSPLNPTPSTRVMPHARLRAQPRLRRRLIARLRRRPRYRACPCKGALRLQRRPVESGPRRRKPNRPPQCKQDRCP